MTGCPSLSTMQTPATVPEGKLRLGVELEATSFTESNSGGGSSTKHPPQFEFNARYGLTDTVDAGVKVYPFGLEVGGKYQFAKGTFEAAVAPAASFFFFDLGGSDNLTITYLHLPLLLGYKLTDSLELAFGPKALFAIGGSSNGQSSDVSTGFLAGGFASIQLRVGDAFWLAPEINVYRPFSAGSSGVIWEGGLALLIGGAAPAAIGPPQ